MNIQACRYNMLFLIIFGLFLHHDDGKAMEQVAVLREMNATTISFMAGVTCLGVGALGTYFIFCRNKSNATTSIEAINKLVPDDKREQYTTAMEKCLQEAQDLRQLIAEKDGNIERLNGQINLRNEDVINLRNQIEFQRKQGFAQGREEGLLEAGKEHREWLENLLSTKVEDQEIGRNNEEKILSALIKKFGDIDPKKTIERVFLALRISPALWQNPLSRSVHFGQPNVNTSSGGGPAQVSFWDIIK